MDRDSNATKGNNRPASLRHLPGTEPAPHHTTRPPPRNPNPTVRNKTKAPKKTPKPKRKPPKIPWKAVGRGAVRGLAGAAIAECVAELVIADEKVQRGKREERDRQIAAGHGLLLFPKKTGGSPPPSKPAAPPPSSSSPPPSAPGKSWVALEDPLDLNAPKEWVEFDKGTQRYTGRRLPRSE